jgi:hypothetical protein
VLPTQKKHVDGAVKDKLIKEMAGRTGDTDSEDEEDGAA